MTKLTSCWVAAVVVLAGCGSPRGVGGEDGGPDGSSTTDMSMAHDLGMDSPAADLGPDLPAALDLGMDLPAVLDLGSEGGGGEGGSGEGGIGEGGSGEGGIGEGGSGEGGIGEGGIGEGGTGEGGVSDGGSATVDTDGDGVFDATDNCVSVPNPTQDDTNGIAAYSIAYAPHAATSTATTLTLDDDEVSAAIDLGFTFNFFGTDYTQAVISSNGFLSFDVAAGAGCCDGPIPDVGDPNGVVAAVWADLYPPDGGTISWEVQGTAPNRTFVATWANIEFCCDAANPKVTSQLVLFEGTNVIEVHAANIPDSTVGDVQTVGIESPDGVTAAALPGHVETEIAMTTFAVRYTTGAPPDAIGDACSNATTTPFFPP